MSDEKRCVKCNGGNVKCGAIQSTGKIYFRPKEAGPVKSGVLIDACMCLDCGFIGLAGDPDKAKALFES